MADRHTRKRRRLNPTESGPTATSYMTNAELKTALKEVGIIISGNLSHKDLQKIYDDNINARRNRTTTTDNANDTTTSARHDNESRTESESESGNRENVGSTEQLSTTRRNVIALEPDFSFGGLVNSNDSPFLEQGQRCAPANRDNPIAQAPTSTTVSGNMEAMLVNTIKLCQQSMETMKQLATSATLQPSVHKEFTLQSAYEAQTSTQSSSMATNLQTPCTGPLSDSQIQETSTICGSSPNPLPSPGTDSLDQKLDNLWQYAVSDRTRYQYDVGVSAYFRFLRLNGSSWSPGSMPPVNEQLLLRFCTYSSECLLLSHSTIKLYLCGIRFYYVRHWGFHPLEKPNGQTFTGLQTILTAIKKKQAGSSKRVRLPITANILCRICSTLDSNVFSCFIDSMLKSACLVAFFGFLRCGEFTSQGQFDQNVNLCTSDVIVLKDKIELTLRKSKTDPFRKGVVIHIYANDSNMCPVLATQQYVSLKRKIFANNPCLSFYVNGQGQPLSRTFFIQHIKSLLTKIGLDANLYNGHSFRSGAATSSHVARLEDHLIQTLGRWTSDCYTRYIHTSKDVLKDAQNQICNTRFLH
ncbi:uncharacterized protein [Argopecten irradians]|uniref:uncharacterized protein n=1 Tax=Argopecten irradians TaxID=31199 RepID=UPI003723605E